MKKFYLFLLGLFMFFACPQIQSIAACPPGFTADTVVFQMPDFPDCDITVIYCRGMLPTGRFGVNLSSVTIEMPCGEDIPLDAEFWNSVKDAAVDDAVKDGGPFEPCPGGHNYMIEYRRAQCWAAKNVPGPWPHPEWGYMQVVDCGYTAGCIYIYTVCTDYSVIPPVNVKTLVTTQEIYGTNCPGVMPPMPPLGKTWFEEWTTECFGVNCY